MPGDFVAELLRTAPKVSIRIVLACAGLPPISGQLQCGELGDRWGPERSSRGGVLDQLVKEVIVNTGGVVAQ